MQSTWSPTLGYGWNTTTYNQNAALYNAVTSDNWTASGDAGLFASEWATLFHDHLVLMAGGRYDNVKNQVKNYNIPATGTASSLVLAEPTSYQAFDYSTSAWTYQLGASLKVVNGLSLYANKSTAFNPQPQLDSYTGLALPNNKANGYEFGLKATLLDGRFNLTADRFLIDEFNVVQSETDPVTGQKDTILSGEQQAKGYETQFTYQVTAGLQFLGDWGYTETKILNSDTLTFLNGLPTRRVPRDNAGLAARYEITHGKLRGLYLLGAVRYFSKSLVNLGSGKSLIPGPAGTTVGATSNMYYVPAKNLTYLSDPKATGEVKLTATPVINVPFPVNGLLPYPNLPANALVNYPVDANGNPLPLSSKGVYVGEPTGVFVDDGRLNNFNAPASVVTVGTGYTWKTGRVSHLLRVDVSNLLNRQYTWGSGVPGMPLQILATYNLHF
jgi:outer membrane receptor protein involved in Fe transport